MLLTAKQLISNTSVILLTMSNILGLNLATGNKLLNTIKGINTLKTLLKRLMIERNRE